MIITIACFGDSLIYGFPYGPASSWLVRVEELCPNLRLLNYGTCGATCDDINDNLFQTVLPQEVSCILYLGGANDLLQRRPLKFIVGDIIKAAKWSSVHTYPFILVLPWQSSDTDFNHKLMLLRSSLMQEGKSFTQILDLQPVLLGKEQELFLDGIHPKLTTYILLGDYTAPLLTGLMNKTKREDV